MRVYSKWVGLTALVLASACAQPMDDEQNEVTESASAALTSADGVTPSASAAAGATPQRRVVHRSKKDPDARRHGTGLRVVTPVEREAFKMSTPKVIGVRPTQLRVDRLRESQAQTAGKTTAKTASVPAESEVVPFGADIVTAPAGEATARVTAAAPALPRAADNSASPAFPEIRDQGALNSCVGFAVGYYQYTYALGKISGWSNKNGNNSTKVSPKWIYNLINNGSDNGSSMYDAHRILSEHGAMTWAEFPYGSDRTVPVNYLAWPTTATAWKNALRYKSLGSAWVGDPTDPAGFAQMKSLLANGQLLNFSTYAYSWEFEQVDDDPSTTADNGFVGQEIATWQDGYDGSHAATIVGYNDDLWVDINANGAVDSGEKGAFKVANSWGTGWKNAGYVWVAYDALNGVSKVTGGPASDVRNPFMTDVMALVGARNNYQPQLLAEFTASTASRGELSLSIVETEIDRTDIIDAYRPFMMTGSAGNYAFDGTVTSQPKTASFAFDLSAFALSYGDIRYRVLGENWGPRASTISNFSLTDGLRGNLKTTTTDPTVTIGQDQAKSQSVRYKFQDSARVPRLAITSPGTSIAFGSLPLGQAAQRQITVQNIGTGDLALSSLRYSNPLFLTPWFSGTRLTPGSTWTIDVEFAPAATQSETGTLSLRNTSSNLPAPSIALSGSATSTNGSAPYHVFITQQNGATDNSVALRVELKSRVSTSTALSNYQVVYYLSDPGLDLSTLRWDTHYTTVGNINGSLRRAFLTRDLGPRKADVALTFRFPAGATLAPGASAIFQGTLHKTDYSWYPNENDDWSRFLRRDGLAEGTIVQQISNQNVLFGLAAERQAGAYQLTVSPNPATSQVTLTFNVTNQADLNFTHGLYVYSELAEGISFIPVYVSALGTQSATLDVSAYPPGKYTAVLQTLAGRVDAYTFTKQ